jgi:uncharacterized protein (TIGR03437 family)
MQKASFYQLLVLTAGTIAPFALWGHSYGPAPRVTGAPGDNARACVACHAGTLNSGTGSVSIVLPGGAVYTPGVKQRITVRVADATQQRWGFELTARLNSDPEKSQAGDLLPVDNFTQVICEDASPKPCVAGGPTFITHTAIGSRPGQRNGASYQFDWMPPATNAGPVTLYVAGNAANGNNANTGDLVYTSSVVVTPALAAAPAINATGGVVSSATYSSVPMTANSWGTIYGSDLSVTSRSWNDGDFEAGTMPFSLDGVSVMLVQFGAPRLAYVGYVSPTQINFVLPADLAAAAVQVQVKNPAGISKQVPLAIQANAPQLFTIDGKYVWGVHSNGGVLGKAGLLASTSTTPAAPGETITIYGTGLGATNPAQVAGQVAAQSTPLATPPQVTIGGESATVVSGAVVTGTAGVYQLAVQVPASAQNGDLPVVVTLGTTGSAATQLTVQR